MIFTRAAAVALFSLAAIGGLCGCSANDHFSRSAVQYNREAEQVQDQDILLNILRASRRRPLEFSGIQTVTGTSSMQGQIGLSIPLAEHGGTTASTFSPQITASGGPTTTVGVIDTQDFYEGLLTPISPKLIDYYIQRGLPRVMLFDLFFSRIDVSQNVKDAKGGIETNHIATFHNTVGTSSAFAAFQGFLQHLVAEEELSTDQPDKPKTFGPLLTASQLLDQPNYSSKAMTAGLEIKEVGWCDLSQPEVAVYSHHNAVFIGALKGKCEALKSLAGDEADTLQDNIKQMANDRNLSEVFYRTQKANTDYRLCFDLPQNSGNLTVCNSNKKSQATTPGKASTLLVFPPESSACDDIKQEIALENEKTDIEKKKNPKAENAKTNDVTVDCTLPVQLSFTIRSTYSIIYYLGEIVRQANYPDSFSGGAYDVLTYVGDGNNVAVPLFSLTTPEHPEDSHFLSVEYEDRNFAVSDCPMDPMPSNGCSAGQTEEVLDLVTELIALNKSAKDLPTTSVITAVGTP